MTSRFASYNGPTYGSIIPALVELEVEDHSREVGDYDVGAQAGEVVGEVEVDQEALHSGTPPDLWGTLGGLAGDLPIN